jgi:fermentation-respiration switch protein FrsA (DUF1100 family)
MKRVLVVTLTMAAALLSPAAAAADPQPLGRTCVPQAEVRFCSGSVATRVPTFDGVPLDADVTLPATGDGPFPTLAMLHGWGGSKKSFETTDPTGGDRRYSNVWFAKQGYAVLTYTARGFGDSCGSVSSRTDPGCLRGWIHLGDQRYEAHDTQYLLGLLVDEGIARPDGLAATGISYGGGQSLMLGYLNDRTRMPDDSFVPWKSPKGTALRLAAAWPRWPWSDLVSSLDPNGRFLDFARTDPDEPHKPIGVFKQSYTSGLFASGAQSGFYSPPGVDPNADLTTWFAESNKGEPETAAQRGIVEELGSFHGAFGLGPSPSGGAAPLLIENGWTDDLFPAPEGLRAYNQLRDRDPGAIVSLQLGDLGHMRGQNKLGPDVTLNAEGLAFLDQYAARTGTDAPKPGSVVAFTQTCPKTADAAGPFRASAWAGLSPGAVRESFPGDRTVTSDGGDPQVGTGIDPVAGGGDPCRSFADSDAQGTAVYSLKATSAFTMLGLPTVRATIDTSGAGGQLDSRLWDVAPGGQKTLVTRGSYRLLDDQKGRLTFQLLGNGWKFERGHTAKLELLGRDAPYLRPSNGQFTVKVSDLTLELPAREKAGSGQVVTPTIGNGSVSGSKSLKRLRLSITPRRVHARHTTRFRIKVLGRDCPTCRLKVVKGARVLFGGKSYRIAKGRRVVKRRFTRRGLLSARATRSGYRSSTLRVRVIR